MKADVDQAALPGKASAMAEERLRAGRLEQYVSNELVVSYPDLRLVQAKLTELDVTYDLEVSRALDLACLQLNDFTTVERRVERHSEQFGLDHPDLRRQLDSDRDGHVNELDLLLEALRRSFRREYGGWTPTMGKNRVVQGTAGQEIPVGLAVGEYVIGHGGDGPPRPAPLPTSWTRRTGSNSHVARVGILDTPLVEHPLLRGAYFGADGNAVEPEERGTPRNWRAGHATFVAGLIRRQAPYAELVVKPVLGSETGTADTWSVANAIVEFARFDVDILNLSLGCFTDDGRAPLVLERALSRLGPEIVVVAAAGNHGSIEQDLQRHLEEDPELHDRYGGQVERPMVVSKAPMWPAAFDGVMAVGASKGPDTRVRADFSPDLPWVRLIAPGVDQVSTYLDGKVEGLERDFPDATDLEPSFGGSAAWSGTSYAAANVSGVIAAGTLPGRRSARAVLDGLLHPPHDPDGYGEAGAPGSTPGAPPFVKLARR